MDIPVISPTAGIGTTINSRYTRLYNNPHFDYLSEMLPKNIKDLFRWCEVVYHNTPVVANAIRKLVNYPVTDFSFVSAPDKVRASTKKLLEGTHMKSALLDFGTDLYVYGNVFRSIYFPFRRFLVCKRCAQKISISTANFKIQNKKIVLTCSCGCRGEADIHDVDSHDTSGIKIVRWDPKSVELIQNPITGTTTYYYTLPKTFVASVHRGDLSVWADSPEVFLQAALQRKNVEFGNNFYHAKTPSLSGYASGWGISPLMPTLKNYMYIAVLRRASEAIGMEHITPQRILFPQTNGSNDPTLIGSMHRWKDEITSAVERWRFDPNYIMTAPFPTGITNIGSQGRALAPTEEIKDARMEMAMALDIPPGILLGDTNIQNSAVSLRIMENQLTPTLESLESFANWAIFFINSKWDKSYSNIKLIPFRLADDIMNKQLLYQSLGTAVSKKTVQEALNLDPDMERERIKQDQLDDHRLQKDLETAVRKEEQNIAAQSREDEQAVQTGEISPYNQQKLIALAQQQAAQLLGIPYEQRRSILAQLQNEDYVMWALVSKQLESLREQDRNGGGIHGA